MFGQECPVTQTRRLQYGSIDVKDNIFLVSFLYISGNILGQLLMEPVRFVVSTFCGVQTENWRAGIWRKRFVLPQCLA